MMAATVASALVIRYLPEADVSAEAGIVDELAALTLAHQSLYHWAADQPQPRALRGRAPVFIATLPDSGETVVIRHAWHGGLLAPITGDRFRVPTRAPHEHAMSHALRSVGIPTTEVLGFARYHAGLGLRRVDVVSRFVPDAYDLGMVAAGLVPEMQCQDALAATRVLLHQLADAGVVHPDLNVKNILLAESHHGHLTAMIIDVDVVRWDPDRSFADTMHANVSRLSRSIRKFQRHFGCDVTDAVLSSFAREALADTPTHTSA